MSKRTDLDLHMQARFIEVEHRAWKIIPEFCRSRKYGSADPRRAAATKAFLGWFIVALIFMGGGGGIGALLTLLLLGHQTATLSGQLDEMRAQSEQGAKALILAEENQRNAIAGILWETTDVNGIIVPRTQSRMRHDALLKFLEIERRNQPARERVNLRKARLDGIDLTEVDLSFVDLTEARLDNAILLNTKLDDSVLDWASLDGAVLASPLIRVSMHETSLHRTAILPQTIIAHCPTFWEAHLDGACVADHESDADVWRKQVTGPWQVVKQELEVDPWWLQRLDWSNTPWVLAARDPARRVR